MGIHEPKPAFLKKGSMKSPWDHHPRPEDLNLEVDGFLISKQIILPSV